MSIKSSISDGVDSAPAGDKAGLPEQELRRAKEGRVRSRKAMFTTLTSASAKAISMCAILVTVPMALKYLGTERYGLWMALSSTLSMLTFTDFGLSNGLLSELSIAKGKGDLQRASQCVTSAFMMLSLIGLVLLTSALAAAPFLPWVKLLNITNSTLSGEIVTVVMVLATGLALGLPLGIMQKIYLASQQGYIYDMFVVVGTVVSTAGIIISVKMDAGLGCLVASVSILPLMGNIAAAIHLRGRCAWFWPRWENFSASTARQLLRIGVQYCAMSLLMAFGLYVDNIIVGRYLGYDAVASLSVPARIVGILGMVTNMICLPFWSSNAEAIARGDMAWVKRILARLTLLNFSVSVAMSGIVILCGRRLFGAWLGGAIEFDATMVALLCLNLCFISLMAPAFMLLNSMQKVAMQIWLYAGFSLAGVCLKVLLVSSHGINGVLFAQTISYALFILLPIAFYMNRLLRKI
jgi:O-antigen/teichoic acid export membrane protein